LSKQIETNTSPKFVNHIKHTEIVAITRKKSLGTIFQDKNVRQLIDKIIPNDIVEMESTIEMKIILIGNESEKVVALQIPCMRDPAQNAGSEDEITFELAVKKFCTDNCVFQADY